MHPTTQLHPSLAIALAVLAAPVHAQLSVVIPDGCATVPGNTNHAWPWGASAAGFPGLRLMYVYDAANFTNQGVTFPILITRLRWRPNEGYPAFSGGTFAQATVALSTAPSDYRQVTANFATNHGPDRTVVHSGAVTHPAGSGGSGAVPAPWSVDIPLTTQFVYDPSQGDLVIDCDRPGGSNFSGGTLPTMDVQGSGSRASLVFASTLHPLANGTFLDHGAVVEVSYVPAAGAAISASYGVGCYETTSASFYETFPPATFDLGNSGITLIPIDAGYVAVPVAGPWFTPVAALPLQNDAVSQALPLGFQLQYPGGSTSAITVSSNGFVWAQGSTDFGCCAGNGTSLVQRGARWCPLWADLDPSALSGTVHFDTDPANHAAYVTFTNVAESGTTNTNTFQVAFFANGIVEYRFGSCTIATDTALTGWSPGNGAANPGSVDLSASWPIITSPDQYALRLTAGSRPLVGTNVTLTASRVPAGSPLGAFVGGVARHLPGLPLASIGMAGCFQFVSLDATIVFLPVGGTGSMVFGVPNVPALSGTHLHLQAAALAAGQNALGVLSSNGLDLRIGTQ